MKSKLVSSKSFIELARKLTDIQELTPEILHTFISKIEIHEKVKDETTGKKIQDIDIYFTHVGKMPCCKKIRGVQNYLYYITLYRSLFAMTNIRPVLLFVRETNWVSKGIISLWQSPETASLVGSGAKPRIKPSTVSKEGHALQVKAAPLYSYTLHLPVYNKKIREKTKAKE